MTSKISYFDSAIFKRSFRKTLPLWICYLLCWLFMMPGTFLSFDYSAEQYRSLTGTLCELVLHFCDISTFVSALIGLIAAWVLFSWLFRANASYFYASLPVRREALFLSNALLGLLMVTLAHLIASLLTFVILLLHGYALFSACISVFAVSTLTFLCFYGFALLLAVIIGQAAVMPAVYVILNFASVALYTAVKSLLSDFVYGMEYTSWWDDQFGSIFYRLSPLFYVMMRGLPTSPAYLENGDVDLSHSYFTGWGYVAALAAAGLVFTVLALLLFRRREMERSGDAIAVKRLRPVFLYCFTVGCSIMLTYILTNLQSTSLSASRAFRQTVLLLIAGAAFGYFIAQMLLKKSVSVFRGVKTWIGLGVVCLVLALGATGARCDILGTYSRVPDVGEIAYVDNSYFGRMSEASDLEALTQFHKLVIERKRENEAGAQENWSSAAFTYYLKDGTRLSYRYRLADSEALEQDPDSLVCRFDALMNSESMVLSRNAIPEEFCQDASAFVYCDIGIYAEDASKNASLPHFLPSDKAYEFYTTCILPDLLDTQLGKTHITAFSQDNERALANTSCADVYFQIEPTDEQFAQYQARQQSLYGDEPRTSSQTYNFYITPDARRSIAYLENLGYSFD